MQDVFQQLLHLMAGEGEAFRIFKSSFEITEFLNSCLKTSVVNFSIYIFWLY